MDVAQPALVLTESFRGSERPTIRLLKQPNR